MEMLVGVVWVSSTENARWYMGGNGRGEKLGYIYGRDEGMEEGSMDESGGREARSRKGLVIGWHQLWG